MTQPLAALQQLYINDCCEVLSGKIRPYDFTVKFLFLMVAFLSHFSLHVYPSVTASALVLSCYYSKLFSPFFQELMSVNHFNPNQLLKGICLM